MQLDVTKALHAAGEEFPFTCSEEMPSVMWDGAEVHFVTPVQVSGTYRAVKEDVWVRADVGVRMRLTCAACLAAAYHDASATMDVCFSHEPDPEDPDLFAFEGHTLQLDDAALGALWLEMPMRVLCAPGCKGLCPHCGANRNQSTCACQKELPAKHPFSALAALLNQDEEV